MIKVAILGAKGYVAEELIRILLRHPEVEIHSLFSESEKESRNISDVFPEFRKQLSMPVSNKADDNLKSCDVAFVSKPDFQSEKWIKTLLGYGMRVIDLSAAYRRSKDEAVYGLTELYREDIKTAKLVANPGCYPVNVILACAPLLETGLVNPTDIIIDSYSGISGAGNHRTEKKYLYCERDEDIVAYKVLEHQDVPEMEQELGILARTDVTVTFVPHLAPLKRGIMSTIYLKPKEGARFSLSQLYDVYQRAYAEEHFVRVMREGEPPGLQNVVGTNFCDIGLFFSERLRRIVLMSATDNLGKGAAGQAIQNMNVMYGFEETTALSGINSKAGTSIHQAEPAYSGTPVFLSSS
jgi:N-acetyl-gamma-glutamyl-phosphate reductase